MMQMGSGPFDKYLPELLRTVKEMLPSGSDPILYLDQDFQFNRYMFGLKACGRLVEICITAETLSEAYSPNDALYKYALKLVDKLVSKLSDTKKTGSIWKDIKPAFCVVEMDEAFIPLEIALEAKHDNFFGIDWAKVIADDGPVNEKPLTEAEQIEYQLWYKDQIDKKKLEKALYYATAYSMSHKKYVEELFGSFPPAEPPPLKEWKQPKTPKTKPPAVSNYMSKDLFKKLF